MNLGRNHEQLFFTNIDSQTPKLLKSFQSDRGSEVDHYSEVQTLLNRENQLK